MFITFSRMYKLMWYCHYNITLWSYKNNLTTTTLKNITVFYKRNRAEEARHTNIHNVIYFFKVQKQGNLNFIFLDTYLGGKTERREQGHYYHIS